MRLKSRSKRWWLFFHIFITEPFFEFSVKRLPHLCVLSLINSTIVTSTDHLMTKLYKMNPQCTAGIVKWRFRWQNSCLKLLVFIHRFKNLEPLGFSLSFLPLVVCCWVFFHLLCVLSFPVALGLWSQWTCKACVRMSQTAFSCQPTGCSQCFFSLLSAHSYIRKLTHFFTLYLCVRY